MSIGKGFSTHDFLTHQSGSVDFDGPQKTSINNSLYVNGNLSSGSTLIAENSIPFSKSLNALGGVLNINSDISGSSYILQNLSPGILLDGSVSAPVIPLTGVSMVGFVGYSLCNTPGKTIDSLNHLMVGSSDQGSTEQCTITDSNGVLIAGQLQTPQLITNMAAIRVHSLFGTVSGAGAITNKYALLSESSGADIQVTSDATFYIGDKNTDGSWRY